MNELVLAKVRVVAPGEVFRGTVQVTGGAIAAVDRNGTAIASAIDLEGDYLVPGLVDVHTDNLERHMLPRPSVRWPGMAALLSHDAQVTGVGITTVLDAVCLGIKRMMKGDRATLRPNRRPRCARRQPAAGSAPSIFCTSAATCPAKA